MNARKCRYCDALIFFATTPKGRQVPLEEKRVRVTLFTLKGDPVRRDPAEPRVETVTIHGYRSHYEKCPGGDRARADAAKKRLGPSEMPADPPEVAQHYNGYG